MQIIHIEQSINSLVVPFIPSLVIFLLITVDLFTDIINLIEKDISERIYVPGELAMSLWQQYFFNFHHAPYV